jgi:RNA polymerase sigma-70 factor (ECF subfamily)
MPVDNGASSYRRFLEGDDSGLVELIRDYKDGLICYLDSMTRNMHTAEELVQETFVKLVTRKPYFSGRAAFKTWLYTIARNVAVDEMRKRKNLSPTSLEELENYLPDEADLERQYLREEQRITVHRKLRTLKPEYSQALYLIYFENMTNEEASQVMKKSKRQFENLLYRGKQALKEALRKENISYEGL